MNGNCAILHVKHIHAGCNAGEWERTRARGGIKMGEGRNKIDGMVTP